MAPPILFPPSLDDMLAERFDALSLAKRALEAHRLTLAGLQGMWVVRLDRAIKARAAQ